MATQNSVDTSLAGQTGTGSFVGSTSPTLVTPTIGAATATSLTFSPTTNGIKGTTTNDDASAGYVGEYIFSRVDSAGALSLSSGTSKNITSISLTAGDWNVWAKAGFVSGTGTVVTLAAGDISTTSANAYSADSYVNGVNSSQTFINSQPLNFSIDMRRISIASTTTIYLNLQGNFAISTLTGYGILYARRVR